MKKDLVSLAKEFIAIEANAISELSQHLSDTENQQQFQAAVRLIAECRGKIVFCGIGKSGHIANKLASTYSSIGIPAIFLHPSEGVHGDLGILDEKDVLIFISYSGETAELNIPIKYASRKKIPTIAMTGNPRSTLAQYSQITLSVAVSKEACPFNLAPTASTTASLVLGDALGLVSATEKGYSAEKFAEIHPSGSLGIKLTRLKDLMIPAQQLVTVSENETVKSILTQMTRSPIRGIAAIIDAQHKLLGVFTDGDIRRFLEKSEVDLTQKVGGLMTKNPRSLGPDDLVEKAIHLMEANKIQAVFVVDNDKKLLGLIHIQNILGEKFR